MNASRAVTVYCSSSTRIAPQYLHAGTALGEAIARAGFTLVYGGNSLGLMKAVADAVRGAGGKVIGVTPKCFCDNGTDDPLCHELLVTETMRERKQLMEDRGDAFIALPGGLGTFEELFEIIVGKQLGYHHKPIVILNIAGYYDPLLAMVEHGVEHGFIKPKSRELYFVADDVVQTMNYLASHLKLPARG